MKGKRIRCLLAACLIALASVAARGFAGQPVRAAGGEEEEAAGWLFVLKEPLDGVSLYSMAEGVEAVNEEYGIYAAETEEDMYSFADPSQIAYCEPDWPVYLMDAPDDPFWADGTQWSRRVLEIDPLWEIGLTGVGVRVGIIDSGVDANHEDLQGAHIERGYDYLNPNAVPTDTYGHGTFVAGVIAAQTNNGIGVAGIAPDAVIVPLRCFDERNSSMKYILQAIYGGVDDFHCDILNMSFGATPDAQDSWLLKEAIKHADDNGTIVVAAVGNGGKDTVAEDALCWPAAFDQVIGVGSVDRYLRHSSFSQKNASVFVAAPGSSVYGLDLDRDVPYRSGSGTSFATPAVSALLALALQRVPDLTRREAMDVLKNASIDLGTPGWDIEFGWGMPTATAMLQELDLMPPHVSAVQGEEGVQVSVEWRASPEDEDVVLYAAAYNANGRMLSVTALTTRQFEDGAAQVTLSGRNIAEIKAITVKGDAMLPICAAGYAAVTTE